MYKNLLKSVALFGALACTLPASAQDATMTYDDNDVVTIKVNNISGRFTTHEGSTTYFSAWETFNEYPGLRVSTNSNNMLWVGENIGVHSGKSGSSTYTIAPLSDDYYVSAYSFTATAATGHPTININDGNGAVTITTEPQEFSVSNLSETGHATFVVGGSNTPAELADVTVVLTPKTSPAVPAESGYYTIQCQAGNANILNKYVATANVCDYQNNGVYSMKYVAEAPADRPAVVYVPITVNGNNKLIFSLNGHLLKNDCTSALPSTNNATTISAVANDENNRVQIGGYWNDWGGNHNTGEAPFVGQSWRASSNHFRIVKAHPLLRYDIWTVNMIGDTEDGGQTTIRNNSQITLNHAENKSIATVYNGGKYFVTKGTELTLSDFTLTPSSASISKPLIIVDNATHTVTVDFTKYMIPVNATTGALGGTGWKNTWTSNNESGTPVTLTMKATRTSNGAIENDMTVDENILTVAAGGNGGSTFTFHIESCDYYIFGYTFGAKGKTAAINPTITPSTSSTGVQVNDTEFQTISADCPYQIADPYFRISNPNGNVHTSDFYVILSPITDEMIAEQTEIFNEEAASYTEAISSLRNLWSDETVDAAIAVAQTSANQIIEAYAGRTKSISAADHEIKGIVTPAFASISATCPINGRLVQFLNKNTSRYLATNNTIAAPTATRNDLISIWQIEVANQETRTVYLKNYANGLNLDNKAVAKESIPMSVEGHPFVLEPYFVSNTPVLGIKDTLTGNHYAYIHHNGIIQKWNAPTGSLASAWIVSLADGDDVAAEVEATVENGSLVLSHAEGLSLHNAYNDELHAIKLIRRNPLTRAAGDGEVITIAPSKLTQAGSSVSFSLIPEDQATPTNAEYEVQIPLGIVKVGANKLSKPLTTSIAFDENGGTTGITEVTSPADAPVVIFDLQGRRLSRPVKGINIINGRKVLVK